MAYTQHFSWRSYGLFTVCLAIFSLQISGPAQAVTPPEEVEKLNSMPVEASTKPSVGKVEVEDLFESTPQDKLEHLLQEVTTTPATGATDADVTKVIQDLDQPGALTIPQDITAPTSDNTTAVTSVQKKSSSNTLADQIQNRPIPKTPIILATNSKPQQAKTATRSINRYNAHNPYYTKIVWDLSDTDIKKLQQIANYTNRKRYDDALTLSEELTGKYNLSDFEREVQNFIFWRKFSRLAYDDDGMDFTNLSAFIHDNPHYPNIGDLREKAEKLIVSQKIPYEPMREYFRNNRLMLPATAVYYLNAKVTYIKEHVSLLTPEDLRKEKKNLRDMVVNIWVNNDFSVSIESLFLTIYQEYLTNQDHIDKTAKLLANDKYGSARRTTDLVQGDYKKLYDGILAIHDNPNNIANILDGIPKKFHNNELLLYEMASWYRRKKQHRLAIAILENLKADSFYPGKWLGHRKYYTRELLKDKEYKIAYNLSKNHGFSRGNNFTELEWQAGWIALSFLNKPHDALKHFEKLYNRVSYPVSVSRAAYWLGRTMEVLKDDNGALKWYEIAAKYPVTFYGQLANYKKVNYLQKIPPEHQQDIYYTHLDLPLEPEITSRDVVRISRMKEVQNAYLNSLGNKNTKYTETLMKRAIDKSKTDGEVALILNLLKEWEPTSNITTLVVRYATYKNVYLMDDLFPLSPYINLADDNSHLLHAVAKQESAFNHRVISRAGAIGYMQLMPATAEEVCRKLKIPYSKHRLRIDPVYNVKVGSGYIADIKNRFDGSDLLTLTTYNAGPTATKRWLSTYFDPREYNDLDKMVDWIELIPYNETRNYVHRIMENAIVYHNIIGDIKKSNSLK